MIWAVLKMILALGMVCGLLFFGVGFLKRRGTGRRGQGLNQGIRVLGTQPLAPQKYISLVEIAGEVLALGISETQVNLLMKIENKAFIDQLMENTANRTEPISLLRFLHHLPVGSKEPRWGLLRRIHG
ncbi:MAG: FliO/MopB family protein [Thermodesulfobacteriota bacterium]